jgi:glycosyltransferase involved in cell wall biosynthesis
MNISLIITTYNWPEALDLVLASVAQQSLKPTEIIIADDGSKTNTKARIEAWQAKLSMPLKHVWQEDLGFRAAMARNRAIALASSEYIVFIDGDCVLAPWMLEAHASLAEKSYWVSGNRALLNQEFSQLAFKEPGLLSDWHWLTWLKRSYAGSCNRYSPLWRLPLGFLRKLRRRSWAGAKTCNLGIWREDLLAVNGFNESFVGWGFEDSELLIRLLRYGILRKEGRFATGLVHLWHKEQPREFSTANWELLKAVERSESYITDNGLNQYL